MILCSGDRVTFRVECEDAVRVFLVGDFRDDSAEVYGMDAVEPGVWQTQMELPPGEYRFCYYLYDGRTIRYQPPEPGEGGSRFDGAKAVLRVGAGAA